MMRPTSSASRTSPVAAIAMLLGKIVALPALISEGTNVPPTRRPRPGSRSDATSRGTSASCWSEFTFDATSIGEPSDMITPPMRSLTTALRASPNVLSST
jgi:hypothetical protein